MANADVTTACIQEQMETLWQVVGLSWDAIDSGALILLDYHNNQNQELQDDGQNQTIMGPMHIKVVEDLLFMLFRAKWDTLQQVLCLGWATLVSEALIQLNYILIQKFQCNGQNQTIMGPMYIQFG